MLFNGALSVYWCAYINYILKRLKTANFGAIRDITMENKDSIIGVSSQVGNNTITIEPDKIMSGLDKFLLTFKLNSGNSRTCVLVDDTTIDLLESTIKLYKVANGR